MPETIQQDGLQERRLLSICGPHDPTHLITMFSAYFDESGTQGGARIFVLAGYVSDIAQWGHFEREWGYLLEANGLPFFHSHTYRSGGSPYRAMSSHARTDIGRRVVGILNRRVHTGVVSAVDVQSCKKWMVGDLAKQFGSPYSLCMRMCMIHVMQWADRRRMGSTVDYFFEAGEKHAGEAVDIYRQLLQKPRWAQAYRLGSIALVDKREILAIQSADPLAYFSRANLANEMDRVDEYIHNELMAAVPTRRRVFDSSEVRSLAKVYLKKLPEQMMVRTVRRFPYLDELLCEPLTNREIEMDNAE